MGTTKSGRVMNTKGSGHYPSEYALIHSSEGDFTKPRKYKKTDRLRLKSGGHSEANLRLLKKYGIKVEITGSYSNGVRMGIFLITEKVINKREITRVGFLKIGL